MFTLFMARRIRRSNGGAEQARKDILKAIRGYPGDLAYSEGSPGPNWTGHYTLQAIISPKHFCGSGYSTKLSFA